MNHLASLTSLRNRYFALRHGESTANVARLIVSHPEHGCNDYALTDHGQQQVRSVLRSPQAFTAEAVTIYSSDFARTKQTADLAAEALGLPGVECTALLRERDFGDLELHSDSAYRNIWQLDALDADHHSSRVESVNQVLERLTRLVRSLEQRHNGRDIVLVSHGDPLQILQTAFMRADARKHRVIVPALHNAELRPLELYS
jgi:probable phosphoglycerate mutase